MSTAQPLIAKVFKSGNSLAIRMPRSIKLKSKTYLFEDKGDSLLLIEPTHETKPSRTLAIPVKFSPGGISRPSATQPEHCDEARQCEEGRTQSGRPTG